jgi:magnesium transporter
MAGKRILWLSILLVAQMFSSMILSGYKHTLEAVVALAFFIPMLMATGGNTGAQSSAMIIRGLAVGEIKLKNFVAVIGRELSTGVILGAGLCALGMLSSYFLATDFTVSIVLGISVTLTVIAAAVIGGTLPLLFRALNLDPALMSGPFITTLVDIIGLFIYFETFKLFFRG